MTREADDLVTLDLSQPTRQDINDVRMDWHAVLRRDVGPDDDFFALGGDSLQAIDVADRIRRRLDVAVEYIDLFDYPTPAKLAARLMRLRQQEGSP